MLAGSSWVVRMRTLTSTNRLAGRDITFALKHRAAADGSRSECGSSASGAPAPPADVGGPVQARGMAMTVDGAAEHFVRELAAELVAPEGRECLACYVSRMLCEFGCDGTVRFALRYRDIRVPRATALARTLADGGGFCDCEVLMNVFSPAARLWTPGRWVEDEDGDEEYVAAAEPESISPCSGVRAGSAKPCGSWERVRRPRGYRW
jgi:Protein of unknown function (DUF2695)